MRKAPKKEIEQAMTEGIVFHPSISPRNEQQKRKVKTKAKKKTYITGAHGSGAARMKADIRQRRANRKSQQRDA